MISLLSKRSFYRPIIVVNSNQSDIIHAYRNMLCFLASTPFELFVLVASDEIRVTKLLKVLVVGPVFEIVTLSLEPSRFIQD